MQENGKIPIRKEMDERDNLSMELTSLVGPKIFTANSRESNARDMKMVDYRVL